MALAASAQAVGKGVMALFSSTIYSGRDIEKINNFRVDAFNHKDFGCLGFMQDDDVYFYSRVYRKHTFESVFSEQLPEKLPSVTVAYFCAGDWSEFFRLHPELDQLLELDPALEPGRYRRLTEEELAALKAAADRPKP